MRENQHPDQLAIDVDLARRLLADQFPDRVDLPIVPIDSTGTENAMFRLGDDLALRLPLRPGKCVQVEKEQRWLPRLAPQLPISVPVPLFAGHPTPEYPSPWSIVRWLPGAAATDAPCADPVASARELAQFVRALECVDPSGGPRPGSHNFGRGVPLIERDATVRAALSELTTRRDPSVIASAWEDALSAPEWSAEPVWVHGDLTPANLLVASGVWSGVIDWGGRAGC